MQIQQPPTEEQIAKIVDTKPGHDDLSAPLKLLIATNFLATNTVMIPKFWIQCETRKLVKKEKHKRTWRSFVAGFPKQFISARYELGVVHLPVFVTTVNIDKEKGEGSFNLTHLEYDDVGFDFKPVAMVINLAAVWWRVKFEEGGPTNWGPVPWIDGQLVESFTSTYTFCL